MVDSGHTTRARFDGYRLMKEPRTFAACGLFTDAEPSTLSNRQGTDYEVGTNELERHHQRDAVEMGVTYSLGRCVCLKQFYIQPLK